MNTRTGFLRPARLLPAFLLALLLLPLLPSAATERSRPTPHELAAIATTEGPRRWYHEKEFLSNPALRAAPEHVVVLHLTSAATQQRFFDHAIPYIFPDTATYTFCVPPEEPFVQAFALFREGSPTPVVRLKRGNQCQTREIVAGLYLLQVRHDGKDIEPEGKKAFIHVARFKGGTQGGKGHGGPKGGDTPSSFPSRCSSSYLANPLFTFTTPDGMFVNANSQANNQIQSTATTETLFGWSICLDDSGNVTLGNGLTSRYISSSGPPNTDTILYAMTTPTRFSLTDLGNGQFTLAANFSGSLYPIILGTDHALHWAAPGTPPTVFTLRLRYYWQGIRPLPLPQSGEVAMYKGCNYNDGSGGTWIFTNPILNFASYTYLLGQPPSLDKLLGSVKLGPQTQAILFAGINANGQAQIVTKDLPCLTNTPLGGTGSSLVITPYRTFLVATDTCLNCDLSGLDLSGLNLAGGRFQGSTFTGADLTNTNLQSASLDNANLSGAHTILKNTNLRGAILRCTNFSGAELSLATFQVSDLVTPIVTTDFSCRVNLTGATVNLNSFPLNQWRYFNLTGATINDVSGATLSTSASPLDLSGALLNQTNLTQVILDGANLGCAATPSGSVCTQLIETSLTSASLKKVDLANTLLQGADLNFANLDGANLCGAKLNQSPTSHASATLHGAFLRNVNLAQADLTGASLKNVNFYSTAATPSCNAAAACGFTTSCASAVNAHLNNVVFTDAYLNGADFSGSTPQSADFSGASLAGSHFTNANLSRDSTNGKRTDFTGALLQGATFTNATVTGADFTNAVVDLTHSRGQILLVQLTPAHLAFPEYTVAQTCTINGSSGQPCTPGCVKFATKLSTGLPSTDSANRCPDGAVGPCNPTQWQTPKVPPAPLPSSCTLITNGATIVTDTSDVNWILTN